MDAYRVLPSMLNTVLEEMKDFSRKKQDEVLNKLKVKMTNRILAQIRTELLSMNLPYNF